MIVITNRDFIAAFSMLNASEEVDKYRKYINIAKVVGKQIKNLKWSNSFLKGEDCSRSKKQLQILY